MAVAFESGRFGFMPDETIWRPGQSAFAREAARERLLERALHGADVVHFNWGESLFPPPPPGFLNTLRGPVHSRLATAAGAIPRILAPWRDLPLLRAHGKTIAVTFQGDDIRQEDTQRQRYGVSLADVVAPGYYSPATDRLKRRIIATFSRHAHIIYALNPDLLHDLPSHARLLPYACVDPATTPHAPAANPRPRIVHAPSDRRVKGTGHVLAAVDQLRARGLAFDFDLVENTPHVEAEARIARGDIFIDQLHAGYYGGAAVHAMAMGKPVVCYLRDADLQFLPAAMRAELPIMSATPESLADVLAALIGQDGARDIGARSRAFVERWHAPRSVAAITAADYAAARVGLPRQDAPL